MKPLTLSQIEKLQLSIERAETIIEKVQKKIAEAYDLNPDAVDFYEDESPAANLYNALDGAVGSCEQFIQDIMNL